MLVVMVDVAGQGQPRTLSTARLSSTTAPVTDFIITGRGKGEQLKMEPVPYFTMVRVLTAYLRESPTVSAFLK